MKRYNTSKDKFYDKLTNDFFEQIGPKYNSLHEAFEDCRTRNPEHLEILNELYRTDFGKELLKSYYRTKRKGSKFLDFVPQKTP